MNTVETRGQPVPPQVPMTGIHPNMPTMAQPNQGGATVFPYSTPEIAYANLSTDRCGKLSQRLNQCLFELDMKIAQLGHDDMRTQLKRSEVEKLQFEVIEAYGKPAYQYRSYRNYGNNNDASSRRQPPPR
eukprot:Platyproteum_vivax@DN15712_c0_g1_i1.p1